MLVFYCYTRQPRRIVDTVSRLLAAGADHNRTHLAHWGDCIVQQYGHAWCTLTNNVRAYAPRAPPGRRHAATRRSPRHRARCAIRLMAYLNKISRACSRPGGVAPTSAPTAPLANFCDADSRVSTYAAIPGLPCLAYCLVRSLHWADVRLVSGHYCSTCVSRADVGIRTDSIDVILEHARKLDLDCRSRRR